MSKAKKIDDKKIKILTMFKDETGEGWARSYGVKLIELPESILEEHGAIIESSEPDIYNIFENNLIKFVRKSLGI